MTLNTIILNDSDLVEQSSVLLIFKRKKYVLISLTSLLTFTFLYLVFIQHIFVARHSVVFDIFLLENWQDLILKERASYNWEPIFQISVDVLRINIAIPNLLLGLFLGLLSGLNISLSIWSLSEAPKACKVNPVTGILTVVPSFFSGFLCCAPTFIAIIGLSSAAFTVFFIDILPFLIPVAIISSIGVFFYSVHKLNKNLGP